LEPVEDGRTRKRSTIGTAIQFGPITSSAATRSQFQDFFFRLIAYFFADSFLFSGAILTLLEVAWYSLHNRQAVSAALFTHFFSSDSECGRN
jgi:hypothetical protein